ncbi:asparagine synthase-related protein [Pandoraea sp. PE-S2T-3]|uniref:asparagine synthase-related protein n=1 Tax=Pandoraea sp. PE-S2T-3 TaxID=1986993 RepID=UPI0015951575|nr:asparagine synthase C-terminal domain-containing protein [Pandoraea sp. PE-S2T-3]
MKLARLRIGTTRQQEMAEPLLVLRGLDGTAVGLISPAAESTSAFTHELNDDFDWYVWGTLFRRSDGQAIAPDLELIQLAFLTPEAFVVRYWGHYRIIVHDRRQAITLVLCDPCGSCPTYFRVLENGAVHVSGDPSHLADETPDFDHIEMKSFLVHGHAGSVQCALRGIERVPIGHSLRIPHHGAPVCRIVWWPAWKMRDQELNDVDAEQQLLTALLQSVRSCVGEQSVVLELSGGLESTSLALALEILGHAQHTNAINYRDLLSPGSNESDHARAVAQHVGIPIEVVDLHPTAFAPSESIPRLARPAHELCWLKQASALRHRLSACGAQRLLNGHGGDAIFLAPPPDGTFIDALADGQWRRSLSAWRDLAIMKRLPIWSIARSAFAQLGQTKVSVNVGLHDLVHPDVCAEVAGRTEPLATAWLEKWGNRVRPGRRMQILTILGNLRDRDVDLLLAPLGSASPFLTQPIIELGLKTPTYRLFNAFHNRLLLRNAAYRVSGLPNLWRRDKGATTGHVSASIAANRQHVEDVCLNGICATSGWIDVDACKRAIGRISHHHCDSMPIIVRLYAVEMFARGWHQSRHLPAAT